MKKIIPFVIAAVLGCATPREAIIEQRPVDDAEIVCAAERACESAMKRDHERTFDSCVSRERGLRADIPDDCIDLRPCAMTVCIAMHRSVRKIAIDIGGRYD